jgi:hypothetical protein
MDIVSCNVFLGNLIIFFNKTRVKKLIHVEYFSNVFFAIINTSLILLFIYCR